MVWKQHEETPSVAIIISNQQNTLFLLLSFMFFFYKIREQKGRTGSAWGRGCHWWGREVASKEIRG
jgi:hypothetical protein